MTKAERIEKLGEQANMPRMSQIREDPTVDLDRSDSFLLYHQTHPPKPHQEEIFLRFQAKREKLYEADPKLYSYDWRIRRETEKSYRANHKE
jgi:hypothetical protein